MVYGATLESYSFIHGMLQAGVPGEQIIFVQPPLDEISCFNNGKIEKLVDDLLKEKGTQVCSLIAAVAMSSLFCFHNINQEYIFEWCFEMKLLITLVLLE